MLRYRQRRPLRILDFDIETLAAGYADPDWVPHKITAAAWSWIGEPDVESLLTDKDGFFNAATRGRRLGPLLSAIGEADIVTGHNILRFDLPVLNAECLRSGLPSLNPLRVIDTIRLPKTKGLKKGQDNLSGILGGEEQKKALTWFEWDEAHETNRWPIVRERVVSDVVQHKETFELMRLRGWLRQPRVWAP